MRSALTQHLQAEQAKRFRDWIEVAATPQESAAREVACKEVTLHVSVRAFGSSANTGESKFQVSSFKRCAISLY